MKGKTHSTKEIIRILRQADAGETAQSVCRAHNISEQTFYRWKKKYGDMEWVDARRLKALEKENAELKKMLAGSILEDRVLKEVNPKKSAVAHAVQQRLCSVRRACTYLSLPRSTYRYIPKPLTDRREQLYQRNHCFILASSAPCWQERAGR